MNRKAIGLVILCGAILVALGIVLLSKRKPVTKLQSSDAGSHPVYSKYDFSKDHGLAHFGILPGAVFAGQIGEIMRRDTILINSLRELGLRMRFHAFSTGTDLGLFVQKGCLDGGMAGDTPTLQVTCSLDLIAPSLTSEGYGSVVANQRMLIRDLAGKRVAFPFGTAAHLMLLEALKAHDLQPERLRLVPMDMGEMPGALLKGEIDAFAAWEPIVSAALFANPKAVAIHRGRHVGFTYFRKEFADNYPEMVRQVLAAEVRAVRWMLMNRRNLLLSCRWALQGVKPLMDAGFEMSPEQLAGLVAEVRNMNLLPIIPESDVQEQGHLHRQFVFLQSVGRIPGSADWATVKKAFDLSIVRQVLDQPKKYNLRVFQYDEREP
jgi:hypothetical protein